MNISKCFLTNSDIYDSDIHGKIMVSPSSSGGTLLFVYFIDFYGERRKMRVCSDLSKCLVTKNNEILCISDINNDYIQRYLLHFLFEVSKEQFEPLFLNKLHFDCGRNNDDGHLSVIQFIDDLYSELPPIPNSEQKMNMLLKAIYDERGTDDLSEISFVNDFKFRAKSYMIDSKELNRYLEELEEDRLIKINGKSVRLRRKGLDYIKNGFKHMKDLNNPIINNGNLAINNGNGSTSNQTQNIGNTFSQENKNDIKEIIQFLKENVENLNLSNDDVTDIKNEVQILESQINRESPKKERINSALGIIQSMLISITANLSTPKVEAIVNKIGGLIGNVPIG